MIGNLFYYLRARFVRVSPDFSRSECYCTLILLCKIKNSSHL